MQNGAATVKKKNSLVAPHTGKHRITIGFSNSTPRYISKRIGGVETYKNVYKNVYSDTVYDTPNRNNPNTHQLLMDKENMVYPYNGVLFSHKRE